MAVFSELFRAKSFYSSQFKTIDAMDEAIQSHLADEHSKGRTLHALQSSYSSNATLVPVSVPQNIVDTSRKMAAQGIELVVHQFVYILVETWNPEFEPLED